MSSKEVQEMLPSNRKYKRFEAPSVQPEDINNILEMCISSLKGTAAKYEDTPEGLADFKQASLDYFEYLARVNNDPSTENFLIPDIESWACYLGTTRRTILTYEKNRGEEWRSTIYQFKEAIAACKKQLIFRQKIPSVIGMFDLTNNHNYVNSNEFKINQQYEPPKQKTMSITDLPGLKDDDGEFEEYLKTSGKTIDDLPLTNSTPEDDNNLFW